MFIMSWLSELTDLPTFQADGVVIPSIASLALEELGCNGDPEREDVIRGVSAGAYAGA